MATISRLLKIIGLFCRISSLFQGSFVKETYNFKEPINHSHPICAQMQIWVLIFWSFCWNRADDLGTDSPVLWTTKLVLHRLGYYTCIYIDINIYIYVSVYIYIYTCIHTHIYIYICTYIHTYIYMYMSVTLHRRRGWLGSMFGWGLCFFVSVSH